jgi:hypothetical protein
MGPLGICAECAARVEHRAKTIPYKARCKLDRLHRRYVKLRGRCRAAETRAEKKEKAAADRATKRKKELTEQEAKYAEARAEAQEQGVLTDATNSSKGDARE